jgi:drug/metabolite transporter (DMT)-like permease
MVKRQSIYYISLILAQIMVGINIVASKTIINDFSIVSILFWRFLISTVLLFLIHYANPFKQKAKHQLTLSQLTFYDWKYIIALGVCGGALFNVMLLWGLNYTTASVAGIITSMLPAIIVIFSILFLKERLTLFSSLCIAFAVMGLLIINASNFKQADFNSLWGDFLIFLALLPEAIYYILAKKYAIKLPLFLAAAIMNAVNLPFVIIPLLFQMPWHESVTTFDVIMISIIGMATGFFYVFWFYGCQYIRGSIAGLMTAAMPVSTLVIAWLFLGEQITMTQFFGMILVIISIVFNVKKS